MRDVIEQAAPRNAVSSQSQSQSQAQSAAIASGGSDARGTEPKPSSGLQADAGETLAPTSKAASDAAAPLAPLTDSAEPAQPVQAATNADIRANEAVATNPVLSTLSQGAIHATAQIAAQIIKKLEGRSTRFEIALTPDDLGQVDVSLNIDADGQLSARLAFDNPLAAADLRGRVDELRRQLSEAGFHLADDALSFDQRQPSAGNGSGFDRGHERNSARAFGAASRLSVDAEASLVPPRWMSLTLTPERVDLKV